MQRLIAAVVALTLFLSAGPVALAAEAAGAPLDQAPEIQPFKTAHFGMSGTVKMDGITVDILGEGDLSVPDRQKSAFKFGPFTAEVVMVGDTVYTRTRFEPRWSRQTSPQVVAVGPISGSEITKLGQDVKLVGTEQVAGVATQHYTSTLDLSPLIEPLLPAIDDRDVRQAIASLNGTVDTWVGVNDRMVRQERMILSIKLPSIEPQGDPMMATLDLTIGYSKLNEPVTITEPSRNDSSPLTTPRPNVAPVVGAPGAPASSTGAVPGSTGQPGTPGTRQAPVQAPAQVPRR
ncbi:MAG: hypothetical protein AB7P40_09930 [Chloroflexota bacterium]